MWENKSHPQVINKPFMKLPFLKYTMEILFFQFPRLIRLSENVIFSKKKINIFKAKIVNAFNSYLWVTLKNTKVDFIS